MSQAKDTSGQKKRYIGLDVHKQYITIGGMDEQQEMVLRPRNVEMERFKTWAEANLRQTDEVVLEATTNTWDIYDTVAPLVKRVVVAHPAEVKPIANARVKTDNQDVVGLLRLLIADLLPDVWVPPVEVGELRAIISYRWRLVKMATAIQNGCTVFGIAITSRHPMEKSIRARIENGGSKYSCVDWRDCVSTRN
jgi:transposase